MIERELETRQTIEKFETIKRMAKRLNAKCPQSPCAIFDKIQKNKNENETLIF
ncbi:MAG: hypothetical protein NC453_26300 [Muribaculum sp.]|nr:hypothetical protein [Muribaculum sp.]